jgi:signal peptidase I
MTRQRSPSGALLLERHRERPRLGDANDSPDPQWVRPEQVRGVLWYAVPGLGHVSGLLTGDQRERGVQVVAVLLLGYAGVMFVSAYRRRRASA